MMKKVWMVGEYKSGEFPDTVWDVCGVYEEKNKAISACIRSGMFYAELELNKAFPDETVEMPVVYPLG